MYTAAWVSEQASSSEVDLFHFLYIFFSLSISFIRHKGVATLPFDPTVPVTGEECTERQCLNLKSGLDVHKQIINFNFHSLIQRVNSLTKSCNKHNQFFSKPRSFNALHLNSYSTSQTHFFHQHLCQDMAQVDITIKIKITLQGKSHLCCLAFHSNFHLHFFCRDFVISL